MMTKPKIQILGLKLENFGSFNGLHNIVFSSGDKNITYFLGEVGSGKTTIFQALWWVLFPDQIGTDTNDIRENEMKFLKNKNTTFVVNKKAIREIDTNGEIRLSAEVKVNLFDHVGNKIEYIVKREQIYFKNNSLEEEITYKKDSDTINISENSKELMNIHQFYENIANLLPQGVREFIFIHGEGLTNLFMHSSELIKKCALNLSDSPKINALKKYLEQAREHFFKKRKEIDSENIKLDKLNNKIEIEEGKIKKLEEEILDLEIKTQDLNSQIIENRATLDTIEEDRKKMKDLKTIREENEKLKENKSKIIELREKYLNQNVPYLYLENSINEILEDIEDKHNKGILPGLITQESLDEILNNPTHCICKTPWDNAGEMESAIKFLYNSVPIGELGREATEFEVKLKQIQTDLNNKKINIYENEKNLAEINKKININDSKASEIKNMLKEDQQEETYIDQIIEIEKKVNENEDTIKTLIETKGNKQGRIVEINKVLAQLNKDYTTKAKKTKKRGDIDYNNYMELIDQMKRILDHMEQIISEEIRKSVEILTIKILKQLAKDPDNWKEIRVKDENNSWILEAINMKDTKIENQSTGQTKILAVSFIFSLSEILGIDLPMVFDSPFVNLDPETRTQIISNIPKIYENRQIIFFLKSTELSGLYDEETGKYNDLRPILDQHTSIKYQVECQNNELTELRRV